MINWKMNRIAVKLVLTAMLESGWDTDTWLENKQDFVYLRPAGSDTPKESGYKYELELAGEIWPYTTALDAASAFLRLAGVELAGVIVADELEQTFGGRG